MRDIDLINAVREYPEVYDPRLKSYKDLKKKCAAWKAISSQVQEKEDECRHRWKTIRDKFVRERRKLASFKQTGALSSGYRTWPLMNILMFLNEGIAHRREDLLLDWSGGNMEQETSNSESVKSDDFCQVSVILSEVEPEEEKQQVEEDAGTSSEPCLPCPPAQIANIRPFEPPSAEVEEIMAQGFNPCELQQMINAPGTRKRQHPPFARSSYDVFNSSTGETMLDEDDHYLLSLKHYFRALNDKSRSLAKIKILEILHNLLYE